MVITQEQMNEMHSIQLEIFKNVIMVCKELNLTYFMVHGSLLGALRLNGFVPLDDDIDIAMPREDYDKLIKYGNDIIDKKYFIQSSRTDKNYPLDFAKVRDNDTTYVAELFRKIDMNHGFFIDVFPIDYCRESVFFKKIDEFRLKLLNIRVAKRYAFKKISFKTKIKQAIACVFYPNWHRAIEKRERINSSVKKSSFVRLTGGKPAESCVPANWFDRETAMTFEQIVTTVPMEYDKYLTQIYGDYKNRTLLETKQHDENSFEINASVLDLRKSFKELKRS